MILLPCQVHLFGVPLGSKAQPEGIRVIDAPCSPDALELGHLAVAVLCAGEGCVHDYR